MGKKIVRFIEWVQWLFGIARCMDCLDTFKWRRVRNYNEFGNSMCCSCYASAVADDNAWEYAEEELYLTTEYSPRGCER